MPETPDSHTGTGAPAFGDRLEAAFDSVGRLCVGIDPHPFLLDQWGLADTGDGLRDFGLRVVDAAAGRAGIVKPQVAFFERHGSAGYAALEAVLAAARAAGLVIIADAKRGDVGSTVEAYGQAWLTPGSPLEADAMTISAYQGVGSIAAPIALAQQSGKGLFVLAATSNPEAADVQTAQVQAGERTGRSVAGSIVDDVVSLNASERAGSELLGSVGLVLGATVDFSRYAIDLASLTATPILAPGFGEQGTGVDELRARYGPAARSTIVGMSRGILRAGPRDLASAIESTASDVRGAVA